MKIKFLAKNLEASSSIKEYVLTRVTNLGKLLDKFQENGGEVMVNFEVSRKTKHKTGRVFHADCTVTISGKSFYASSDEEDMYEAIDKVKNVLFKEINQSKNKKKTLVTRGARSVKKMMKGLSKRNPETGTYSKNKK